MTVLKICITAILLLFINSKQNTVIYEYTKIGSQKWMKMNLDKNTFNNGDIIPEVKSEAEWIKYGQEGKPAICYYSNLKSNGIKYGALYNYWAVKDERGLAPEGWHIPSESELNELMNFSEGEGLDSGAYYLKDSLNWNEKIKSKNSFGFNALPSGYRYKNGKFFTIGIQATWWTTSSFNTSEAFYYSMQKEVKQIIKYHSSFINGYSVRCIKGSAE
jgi:uncharacterized protein (TIGR02145 family)